MIGFFTDPFPDELLYSAVARYCGRVRYPNRRQSLEEIFGNEKISAVFDFPTRLNHFVSSLPVGSSYSAEALIDENSLLPFYEPFLPIERVSLIRREMRDSTDNKIPVRLGIRAKQIKSIDYVRFCPICVDNDRKTFGQTYWHRGHQLTGILVCAKHECFLEDSELRWDRRLGLHFHSAEKHISAMTPRYINIKDRNHKILLKIANDAKWLLSQKNLSLAPGDLQKRYFNLLLKKGFAYYNGRVRHNKLVKACDDYFSHEFLKQIGRISKRDNWLTILVEPHKHEVVFHPIRHLLLMTFLDLTAEEFFTSFVEFKPFGEPPYPCLNKAAEHYREMRINQCEIYDNLTKDDSKKARPVAYFTCDCGFIYQRVGPDESKEVRFNYSYVREYGHTWEEKLTELWSDLTLSVSETGKRLGVSELTVRRHAIRLNLPMNTEHARSLRGYNRHRNPKRNLSELKQDYRNGWLEVIKNNPGLTRNELMKAEIFLYLWLRRNDEEWIEEHLPPVNKIPKDTSRLDWEKIDKDLSKEIETVCREIYNLKKFPVRVSITEVIRRIGYKKWLDKRLSKLKTNLPLTNQVLNENLETLEDYMIRKILWAKHRFIQEGIVPTLQQLKVRAVVRNKISDNSIIIQKTLVESIEKIKNSIHK